MKLSEKRENGLPIFFSLDSVSSKVSRWSLIVDLAL
jgi:hypothetical protein